MKHDFLVELGCEELPPKALNGLIGAFAEGIKTGLAEANLTHAAITTFSAPRRLAVKVSDLSAMQPEQLIEKKGPAIAAAYDKDGNPSPALLGFARSANVDIKDLIELDGPKGKVLGLRSIQPGQASVALLPEIVSNAIKKLPIQKPMRWGARQAQFVRPVHWLLMMYGETTIPANILEQESGNVTYGHRFHYPKPISVASPDDYERALLTTGFVMANFTTRRDAIKQQILNVADSLAAEALIDESLLEEVANIVEWPVAMACRFEEAFLKVPQEALISAMQGHQKCFPLTRNGKLINHFITISNIESKHPESVVSGNEKVMRARLSDAAFFYETDCKVSLDSYQERLAKVTFQARLGSLKDKAERVAQLAVYIAGNIGSDVKLSQRAAELCKADLMTNMVGEFPELQGIMGRYYALAYKENAEVAAALDEQYWPKFAGDKLPNTKTGQALSLADKLDTLVGIFGIGQKPSGSKDPFALRRAAIGALRILIEKHLNLDLDYLLEQAAKNYGKLIALDTVAEVLSFMFERLRAMYQEQGISTDIFEAVYAKQNNRPYDFSERVLAVREFLKLPEAKTLIAANKRVYNILSKNDLLNFSATADAKLFQTPEETNLHTALNKTKDQLKNCKTYIDWLCNLASLKDPIDGFFDKVMVMAEDENIRNNRLALLSELREIFSHVADIAKLQE